VASPSKDMPMTDIVALKARNAARWQASTIDVMFYK
jgi:hypothetical protein